MKSTKEQKGITLIALVVTIIVLLILAGIAILMVSGNNGLLQKAADAKVKTDSAKTEEVLKLFGQSKLIDELTKNGTSQPTLAEIIAQLKSEGVITDDDVVTYNPDTHKISINGVEVNYAINITETKQWNITTDNDSDGNPDVGDLLAPTVDGLSNEKFYVIADNGTSLTLLAERCINTSSKTQVNSGYSTSDFDDNSNIYNGSTIQGLVNTYVGNLTGLTLENVEVEEGGNPVSGVKGRLMWHGEATALVTTYSDVIYGPTTARLDYWLGSADNRYEEFVWYVRGANTAITSDGYIPGDGNYSIRPVIKISKSLV